MDLLGPQAPQIGRKKTRETDSRVLLERKAYLLPLVLLPPALAPLEGVAGLEPEVDVSGLLLVPAALGLVLLEPEAPVPDELEPEELGLALEPELGLVLEPEAPGVALPPVLPLPELELSELPELPPLAAGEAPDGEDELDGVLLEGMLLEEALPEGEAPGMDEDEDEVPEGEAPEDEDDDESLPAAGAEGVLGVVVELVLGEVGAGLELVLAPGEVEDPAVPSESLLQPASNAARILAANRTLEGWVSFIVAFLLQIMG